MFCTFSGNFLESKTASGTGEDEQHLQEQSEEEEVPGTEEDASEDEAPAKRQSVASEFFIILSGESKTVAKNVKCTLCNKHLSRGTANNYSHGTTSTLYHLKTFYKRHLKRAQKEREGEHPFTSRGPPHAPGDRVPVEVDNQRAQICPELRHVGTYCLGCNTTLTAGEECVAVILETARKHTC